eukprot:403359766
MYGAPINLMYKSKDTYQTIYGGLFTIITRLLVLAFFIYGLIDVYNKQNSIVKKTLYRDPLKENVRIDVDQQKFDMGITFSVYDYNSDFYDNIYRYFQVKVSNATVSHNSLGGYDFEEDFFPLSYCSKDRFGGDEVIAEQMVTDSLLCPDNLKFLLAGSLTGNFSTFAIFIKPCDNDILIQQNKNFTCAQGVQQYFNLQQSYVDTQDSWFGNMIGNVQYSYLELISGALQYFKAVGGNAQFSIQFYTSKNEDHITRTVKTFIDCISLTGGLSSVIALIAKLTIVKIQQQYLHQSIIKKMFKIQKTLKKRGRNLSIKERNEEIQQSSLLQHSVDYQDELKNNCQDNNNKERKKTQKSQFIHYQTILSSRFDIVKVLKSTQKSSLLLKLSLDENQQLLSNYTLDGLIPSQLITENEPKENSLTDNQIFQLKNDDLLSKALVSLIDKSKIDKLSQKLLNVLLSQEEFIANKESLPKACNKPQSPSKSSRSKSFKKAISKKQIKEFQDQINQENYVSDAISSLEKTQEHAIGKQIKKQKTKGNIDEKNITPVKKNKR